MHIRSLLTFVFCLLLPSVGQAQSGNDFIAIPSSGFTPMASFGDGNISYSGNDSGTARKFAASHTMFAPANLPHGALVTSFSCGGKNPNTNRLIQFTLRRNQPQQANLDIATMNTDPAVSGFQFVHARAVEPSKVDNSKFNYYVVAQRGGTSEEFGACKECLVGFCTIGVIKAPQ